MSQHQQPPSITCTGFLLVLTTSWLVTFVSQAAAQGSTNCTQSNAGQSFLVAFMLSPPAWNKTLTLYAGSTGNAVSLTVSFNPSSTIQINPNEHAVIRVPPWLELDGGGVSQVIQVTANDSITIVAHTELQNHSEAYLALPVSGLGRRYFVVTYPSLDGNTSLASMSQFAVAAVDNATVVTVKLSGMYSGTLQFQNGFYQAGGQFSFTLNQFQAVQLQSSADLTGTEVTSSKKIAVWAGNVVAQLDAENQNFVVEQMIPVDPASGVSSSFAVPPLPGGRSYTVKVVAAYPGTTVNFVNQSSTTDQTFISTQTLPNSGDYLTWFQPSKGLIITTSSPVTVCKLTYSNSAPAMTVVPPINRLLPRYNFVIPSSTIRNFIPLTTILTNGLNQLSTDGYSFDLASSTWDVVPGTTYNVSSFGTSVIGNATHRLASASNSPVLAMTVYGWSAVAGLPRVSYLYSTGQCLDGLGLRNTPPPVESATSTSSNILSARATATRTQTSASSLSSIGLPSSTPTMLSSASQSPVSGSAAQTPASAAATRTTAPKPSSTSSSSTTSTSTSTTTLPSTSTSTSTTTLPSTSTSTSTTTLPSTSTSTSTTTLPSTSTSTSTTTLPSTSTSTSTTTLPPTSTSTSTTTLPSTSTSTSTTTLPSTSTSTTTSSTFTSSSSRSSSTSILLRTTPNSASTSSQVTPFSVTIQRQTPVNVAASTSQPQQQLDSVISSTVLLSARPTPTFPTSSQSSTVLSSARPTPTEPTSSQSTTTSSSARPTPTFPTSASQPFAASSIPLKTTPPAILTTTQTPSGQQSTTSVPTLSSTTILGGSQGTSGPPLQPQSSTTTLPVPSELSTTTLPVTSQSSTTILTVPSQSSTTILTVPSQSSTTTLPVTSQSTTTTLPVPSQSSTTTLPVPSQSSTTILTVPSQSSVSAQGTSGLPSTSQSSASTSGTSGPPFTSQSSASTPGTSGPPSTSQSSVSTQGMSSNLPTPSSTSNTLVPSTSIANLSVFPINSTDFTIPASQFSTTSAPQTSTTSLPLSTITGNTTSLPLSSSTSGPTMQNASSTSVPVQQVSSTNNLPNSSSNTTVVTSSGLQTPSQTSGPSTSGPSQPSLSPSTSIPTISPPSSLIPTSSPASGLTSSLPSQTSTSTPNSVVGTPTYGNVYTVPIPRSTRPGQYVEVNMVNPGSSPVLVDITYIGSHYGLEIPPSGNNTWVVTPSTYGPDSQVAVINASDSIVVTPLYRGSCSAYLPIANSALGNDYQVLTWNNSATLSVMSTDRPAAVRIRLSGTNCRVKSENVTFLCGDVFTVFLPPSSVKTFTSDSDLSGTYVQSDMPVAVLVGNPSDTKVGTGNVYADAMASELFPVSAWGQYFGVPPVPDNDGFGYALRIGSVGQEARITYSTANNQAVELSVAKDSYITLDFAANQPVLINSSVPVQVIQFVKGAAVGSASSHAAPAALTIPAVERFANFYSFSLTQSFTNFLVVVMDAAADRTQLLIDNETVPETADSRWRPVGPSGPLRPGPYLLVTRTFQMPTGALGTVSHPSANFGAFRYSFFSGSTGTDVCELAYPAGAIFPTPQAPSSTTLPPSSTFSGTLSSFQSQTSSQTTSSPPVVNSLLVRDCSCLNVSSSLQPSYNGYYYVFNRTVNGEPVYKRNDCDLYLFLFNGTASYYVYGPTPGANRGMILNSQMYKFPVDAIRWEAYNSTGGMFVEDPSYQGLCSCPATKCASVELLNRRNGSFSDGVFKFDQTTLNGRPVYKHDYLDLFIYYQQTSDTCQRWMVGATVGSNVGVLYANDRSFDAKDIPASTPWKFLNGTLVDVGLVCYPASAVIS